MNLQGKHVVVTGAASGIGLAIVRALAPQVQHLLAVDIDEQRLRAAVGDLRNVTPFAADLSQQAGTDATFEAAEAAMGHPIDLFVANAGIPYYEAYQYADWARVAHIFHINVVAPLYALGKMRERQGNTSRPYTVLMTASAMAKLPLPGYALYSATKAALDHFAEAYAFEAPAYETLTLLYPIATRTHFFDRANDMPVMPPTQAPEDVARAVVRGLESGARAIYPSRFFRITYLIDRYLPLLWLMQRFGALQFNGWRRRHPKP